MEIKYDASRTAALLDTVAALCGTQQAKDGVATVDALSALELIGSAFSRILIGLPQAERAEHAATWVTAAIVTANELADKFNKDPSSLQAMPPEIVSEMTEVRVKVSEESKKILDMLAEMSPGPPGPGGRESVNLAAALEMVGEVTAYLMSTLSPARKQVAMVHWCAMVRRRMDEVSVKRDVLSQQRELMN